VAVIEIKTKDVETIAEALGGNDLERAAAAVAMAKGLSLATIQNSAIVLRAVLEKIRGVAGARQSPWEAGVEAEDGAGRMPSAVDIETAIETLDCAAALAAGRGQ